MCVCVSGVLSEEPNKGVHTSWRNSEGKFASHVLRLNNNLLSNMTGLMATLSALFVEPKRLAWLDLSFNNITHIHLVNIHRYWFHFIQAFFAETKHLLSKEQTENWLDSELNRPHQTPSRSLRSSLSWWSCVCCISMVTQCVISLRWTSLGHYHFCTPSHYMETTLRLDMATGKDWSSCSISFYRTSSWDKMKPFLNFISVLLETTWSPPFLIWRWWTSVPSPSRSESRPPSGSGPGGATKPAITPQKTFSRNHLHLEESR